MKRPKHKTTVMYCFHGSPGSPEDFDSLIQYLENIKVIVPPRYTQKILSSLDKSVNTDNKRFVLGYSWGGIPAINYAISNSQSIAGIILVSPYLFPAKSKLIKIISDIPVFGGFLLNVMGNKFINNMLKKSSYPDLVPLVYKKTSLKYVPILKDSIDEKSHKSDVFTLLRTVKKFSIPLILIWGDKDLISHENTQIKPIRAIVQPILEEKIKNAGHALIFTRPKQVAQIILKAISIL